MPSGTNTEAIWLEEDCAVWVRWLFSYEGAIEATENAKLANLDKWIREELPKRILERRPPYLHHDEMVGITAWKMHRGVWRENNRRLVASNTPEAVEEASLEAFSAVPDPRKPVALLTKLAGVGPATASAALAAYAPYYYPFFDEVVANAIPGLGPVAFTLPYYLKYANAIAERRDKLNSYCSSTSWTSHSISQALWAVGSPGGGK